MFISEGIVNADGSTVVLVGATALKPNVGLYVFPLQCFSPKLRRIVQVHLLWNGGISNGLVAQYAPEYSNDAGIAIKVSTHPSAAFPNGEPADAAFSFSVRNIP